MEQTVYPLAAMVGQKTFRQGLLLAAVNPAIGGILVRGEKGTAKSTMVRALAALLPDISVVRNCAFSCSPEPGEERCPDCQRSFPQLETTIRRARLINLPLNATEDRVAGGIDFPRSLQRGKVVFSPGLLASAHRGLLYVDEVNLLDDHIVDLILDAAASGENRVEREGISFRHPARFILVGTMNPEEGELRPQLTDRFGLCVQVVGLSDPALRQEVILRRLEFERDPARFARKFAAEGQRLAKAIVRARKLLPRVTAGPEVLERVVKLVLGLGVDGHRGDLTLLKTAITLAALDGRKQATPADVDAAALLALPHRLRRRPLAEMEFDIAERIKRI